MKGLFAILSWLIAFPLLGQPVGYVPPGPGGVPGQAALPTNGLPLPPGTRALIEQLQSDIEQLHSLLAVANGGAGAPDNAPFPNGVVPYLYPEPPPPHPQPNFGQSFAGNFSQNFSVNLGQNLSTLTTVTPPGVTPLLPPKADLQVFPFPIAAPPPPPPSPAEAAPPGQQGQNELMLLHDLELQLQQAQADIQELLPRLDRQAGRNTIPNGSGGADPASPDQSRASATGFNPNANGLATPSGSQFARPLTNRSGQLPGTPPPHP